MVLAAAAWAGYAALWTGHVDRVGRRLVARADQRAAAVAARPAACLVPNAAAAPAAFAGQPGDPVRAVLEIPSIHLTAPVEQGDSDAVLAVAVGHLPDSVWPGTAGTAVLAAHDVSYFVGIDQLRRGDPVDLVTPCTTFEFAVTGEQVVRAGTPLYNSTGPSLVLETCWPTDALWYTPDRYLVTATEVATRPTPATTAAGTSRSVSEAAAEAVPPAVHLPAALVATGLSLATNAIPMGTMTVSGSPPANWVQSPAPLAVESSALEAFIGGLKAAETDHVAWWQAAAPGLPVPGPLVGATVADWHQGLGVEIAATGTTATAVTLTATVTVAGGSQPGLYHLTVTEPITAGVLSVGGWLMEPAG